MKTPLLSSAVSPQERGRGCGEDYTQPRSRIERTTLSMATR